MSKTKSLRMQASDVLYSKRAYGESKHTDKRTGASANKIYSARTMKTYKEQCYYYVDYCKAEYGCKTLDECHSYVNDWLQEQIDRGYSAWTICTSKSAIAKLYGERTTDYMQTPARRRADIKQSRGDALRDQWFDREANADIVSFAQSTGLRRFELAACKGSDLWSDDAGNYYIHVDRGKGGRERDALVYGDVERVVELCANAGNSEVFEEVPVNMDVHSCRGEYARALYEHYARDYETCRDAGDLYVCRGDLKGHWFDREAMLTVSEYLGHSRVNVMASHYITDCAGVMPA